MARPQIHGYDLNCIGSIGASRFVSGADEKLLRVFDEPKSVAKLLSKVCGIGSSSPEEMPDAANMPVLGLSNKAIEAGEPISLSADVPSGLPVDLSPVPQQPKLDLDHPPLEDHLARHTLWPEVEKLYGHGYEISTLAASHDGKLIATACRATSIDHAVIRLFETTNWLEIKPPLTSHSSTVTRLRFSADDKYLLSVGRDRQWTVFERAEIGGPIYHLKEANPKGHTRMILDAAWAPTKSRTFATAGRDKMIKVWSQNQESNGWLCTTTVAQDAPVTSLDIADVVFGRKIYLAIGTESGVFTIATLDSDTLDVNLCEVRYSW
jgi:elongator complex protein 2